MSPFLAWGDFHARSGFSRSTIPEEKWGTTRSLLSNDFHTGFASLVQDHRGKFPFVVRFPVAKKDYDTLFAIANVMSLSPS